MAPVILEIESRGWSLNLIMTGQHLDTMELLLRQFGLRTTPRYIYRGTEITGMGQMFRWFFRSAWRLWRQREALLPSGAILVHGDTASTLLGGVVGRMAGMTVVHVESGLRSPQLFHPFPEEVIRRAMFRLAQLAFCPGPWAMNNLATLPLRCIDTGQNTLIDALKLALSNSVTTSPEKLNQENYGVVSLHRAENIFRRQRLFKICELIEAAARHTPLLFVLHPSTRKKLVQYGLLSRLEANPLLTLVPRMGYTEFIRLVAAARFVISDGGGNQEELAYLGVPTLLMRRATERQEGLGKNAVLCPYDERILGDFLSRLPDAREIRPLCECSPSACIVEHLAVYAH